MRAIVLGIIFTRGYLTYGPPLRCRPAEFPKFQDPESDDEDSRVGKMPPADSDDDA